MEINPKFEDFKENKNLRHIQDNEIVLECDNREKGFEGINFIGINLYKAEYKFEVWYAEGQKSPHIHIKDIRFLNLEGKELKKYKELFMNKYTPREYIPFSDKTLCQNKHLIAEENKPHFKYKTIKKLLSVFNEGKENFAEPDLIELSRQQKSERKVSIGGPGITAEIIKKISIIKIAKRYGVSVNRQGFALCPFHPDNKPSLKFYDSEGRFCCFGCNRKGNLIDFIYLLRKHNFKELKNE